MARSNKVIPYRWKITTPDGVVTYAWSGELLMEILAKAEIGDVATVELLYKPKRRRK